MTEELQNVLERCPAGLAARLVGVSVVTLHNWRRKGRIEAEQDAAGRWRFDVRPHVKATEARA